MKKLTLFAVGIVLSSQLLSQIYNRDYQFTGTSLVYNENYSYKDNNNTSLSLSDDSYIISTYNSNGSVVSKFDVNGSLLWSQDIYLQNTTGQIQEITESANNDLVYAAPAYYGFCIGRLDAMGALVWGKTISRNTTIYASNKVYGVSDGTDQFHIIGFGNDSALAVKTDMNGNILWSKSPKFTNIDQASANKTIRVYDVIKNSIGNYVCIGTLEQGAGYNSYMYLLELDPSGNFIRMTTTPYDKYTDPIKPKSIVQKSNGDYLIAGVMRLGGNEGSFVIQLNSNGTFISGKHILDFAEEASAIEMSNGEIVVGAGNMQLVNDGNLKNSVVKMDPNLNPLWGRSFGINSMNKTIFINENSVGNIVAAGKGINTNSFQTYSLDKSGNAVGCFDTIGAIPTATLNLVFTNQVITVPSIVVNESAISANVNNVSGTEVFPGLNVVGSINNPQCFGQDGSIDLNVSGGSSPYSYNWSNGTNSQNLVNVSAGTYVVRVGDGLGCVDLDTFNIIEPSILSGSFVTSNVTCFGALDGSIDLTVTGGTPGYTYQWANQATTQDINGLTGGFYQVIITDANGCEKTMGITISEPQQLFAAITNSQNITCNGACDGMLTGLASGGTSPYSLTWNDPSNTSGATVSNLCPGNYLFTVIDNNGCTSYANASISEPYPLITSGGSTGSECMSSNGSAYIGASGGTTPYTYSWTVGSTNDTVTGLNPGSYDVTVTDNNGCQETSTVDVSVLTNPVEICVVSVDSTNHNLIVWEKPVVSNIQGFFIYRNISGAYSQIGYQPYDSLSQFVDYSFGVDPNITSYRYEISVLDSCGNESILSNYHETIHLTTNAGINGEVNLIWDSYEGFTVNQYYILRDSTGLGNWEVIDSVLSTNFTYTDLTPPQSNNLNYLVEVVLPYTCTSTKQQSHNTTRSNRVIVAGGATGLEEMVLNQAEVYPNPFNETITISIPATNWEYKVFDISGKMVKSGNGTSTQEELHLSDLEKGLYIVQISINQQTINKQIVKL